ncbi:hypothetical protein DACRYDRAFT_108090 [Dacryopinax primogenitus]|uniref:Uncharacterized protein n=1 Tax=Dacryopinax primogenitus (strain DJM 731) TaxID=1858805 RepID=M5G065_DACPD|nr:uncharacterized protein DACRYDRAFT_108090 [Dacryopinax primogenitus]EJU01545.1 hypothetical protein DACRYDRAFT_108090 [Dacryopinax primogenitus]
MSGLLQGLQGTTHSSQVSALSTHHLTSGISSLISLTVSFHHHYVILQVHSVMAKDKGKSRAMDTSPLLSPTLRPPPSTLLDPTEDPAASSSYSTFPPTAPLQRGQSYALTAFLSFLSLAGVAVLLLLLLGWSYAYPSSSSNVVHALHVRGPSSISVTNFTSEGLYLRVQGEVGIDADWVLGFRTSDDQVSWAERIRRAVGRWGVREVEALDVRLGNIDLVSTSSRALLATLSLPPLTLPLTPNLRATDSKLAPPWLKPISVDVLIHPSTDPEVLTTFAKESWAKGRVEIEAACEWVRVTPAALALGGEGGSTWGWPSLGELLTVKKGRVDTPLRMTIPSLPGFPRPGTPLKDMLNQLTIEGYAVHPLPPAQAPGPTLPSPVPGEPGKSKPILAIKGAASVPFPVLPFPLSAFDWPYEIPFLVSLLPSNRTNSTGNDTSPTPILASPEPTATLSPLPIAAIHTSPLSLPPPGKRLNITLHGELLPPPPSSPLLSAFLSAYLSGHSYPVLITSPPPYTLPTFLHPFLSTLHVSFHFPGASPPPQLLDSVQIRDTRILPSNKPNEFLISGLILAHLKLPPAFKDLIFSAKEVQPDVYITDGPPESGLGNAFARLSPPALPCSQENMTILAPLDEVPVHILPGREKRFREFVQKVLWKGSAYAGVEGEGAVRAGVGGLGEVSVAGVHVRGGSWVGRKGEEGREEEVVSGEREGLRVHDSWVDLWEETFRAWEALV